MLYQENGPFKCGIIADDCGLGKSLLFMSLVVYQSDEANWHFKFGYRLTLIVAPCVILQEWIHDYEIFFSIALKRRHYFGLKFDQSNSYAAIILLFDPFKAKWQLLREFSLNDLESARAIVLIIYSTFYYYNLMSQRLPNEAKEAKAGGEKYDECK